MKRTIFAHLLLLHFCFLTIFSTKVFSDAYYIQVDNKKGDTQEILIEGKTNLPEGTLLFCNIMQGGAVVSNSPRTVEKGFFRFSFQQNFVPGKYVYSISLSMAHQVNPAIAEELGGIKAPKVSEISSMKIKRDMGFLTAEFSDVLQVGSEKDVSDNEVQLKQLAQKALLKMTEMYIASRKIYTMEDIKKKQYKMPFNEEEWTAKVSEIKKGSMEIQQILADERKYLASTDQKRAFAVQDEELFMWVENMHRIYYLDINNRPLNEAIPAFAYNKTEINLKGVEKSIREYIKEVYALMNFSESEKTDIEYAYKSGMAEIKTIIQEKRTTDKPESAAGQPQENTPPETGEEKTLSEDAAEESD
jgi:hypothetical protein